MIRDLLPLFALVGAAVAIWVLRARYRRLYTIDPPAPDITLAEAWEMWRAGITGHPDGEFHPADGDAPHGAFDALAQIERQSLAADYPRSAIRAAVLDFASLALHLDAISALGDAEREALLKGYVPGMDNLLRDAVRTYRAEWMVLRWYARMKYDDAVPRDWFHHYLRVAGPYVREKVRLAREHLIETNEGAARFAEVYDKLLDDLRRQMLASPPKKRYPPSDLPVS